MKTKCKQCGKPHDKYTLDLMSATKTPKPFCSGFCQNLALLNNLPTDQKEFAYIKCAGAHTFKGQEFVNVGGQAVKIEHVFADGIEISKPKGVNEPNN